LLTFRDRAQQLIGIAPWFVEYSHTRGSVIRTLGCGAVCSEYVTVLSAPEHEHIVADELAVWLGIDGAGAPAGPLSAWDALCFECVPTEDLAAFRLADYSLEAGSLTTRVTGQNVWRIALPETWEQFLRDLSRSHRKQILRSLRELWDTGRAKLTIASDPADLPRFMDQMIDLHQRRWQAAGEPGVFSNPAFAAFLREVAPRMLATESLQLSLLELDGRPAAADFHLLGGTAQFVYQGGIEPEMRDESPGRLLTALLIRGAIEEHRTTFDFLRGDESYKAHYRAVPVPTQNIHVVPQRTASRLRHSLWLAGITAKNLVKTGMSLTGIQ